jgi:hypothetical protein
MVKFWKLGHIAYEYFVMWLLITVILKDGKSSPLTTKEYSVFIIILGDVYLAIKNS